MKSCKHSDNWCQEEKRGCKGCYYNRANKKSYVFVEKDYLEDLIRTNERLKQNIRILHIIGGE